METQDLARDHKLSSLLLQLKEYFGELVITARGTRGVLLALEDAQDLERVLLGLHDGVLALECRYLSGERSGSEGAQIIPFPVKPSPANSNDNDDIIA